MTFIWRGNPGTHNVGLLAPLSHSPGMLNFPLTRLPNTDVWYKTWKLRDDLRFTYRFVPEVKPSDAHSLQDAKVDPLTKSLENECIVRRPSNDERVFDCGHATRSGAAMEYQATRHSSRQGRTPSIRKLCSRKRAGNLGLHTAWIQPKHTGWLLVASPFRRVPLPKFDSHDNDFGQFNSRR